jgi:hypothetical protein
MVVLRQDVECLKFEVTGCRSLKLRWQPLPVLNGRSWSLEYRLGPDSLLSLNLHGNIAMT